MPRRNYFELLGLDFDPPEKNLRKIQKAIAAWKAETEKVLNTEQIATRKAALEAELSLADDMAAVMQNNKTRNDEARELKNQRVAQLESLLDILLAGKRGQPLATMAQIRDVMLKLNLSQHTVENVFARKGFEIKRYHLQNRLKNVFLPKVVFDNINDHIVRLNHIDSEMYPRADEVSDLYDLAFYSQTDARGTAEDYRHRRTADLLAIMKDGASQFASDMSPIGHIFEDLFTAGVTQVFDSEANRSKYEQSLKKQKLEPFFSLLKAAPDVFKHDRYFVENCIKIIQMAFYDYDISLALYNQEAGILQSPYEPMEAVIHLTCPACHQSVEYHSREEAEMGKCPACGADLYVECPQCHKRVPAAADWCACGFRLSEMRFFEEYCQDAWQAFEQNDYRLADQNLQRAQRAYPGHPKLKKLQKDIKEQLERSRRYLSELQVLMSAGRYCRASELAKEISQRMPQMDLSKTLDEAAARIEAARKAMPSPELSGNDRIAGYARVLDIVSDYRPAFDMLGLCRPAVPRRLVGTVSSAEPLICKLTWEKSDEPGISYCIVRKENGIPRNRRDGDTLAINLQTQYFRDRSIQPDTSYGYAVFACRQCVYSKPAIFKVEG